MTVSCNDFVDSARTLIRNPAEMDFRNAASRAYYGAYHKAISVAESIGIPADVDGGTHAAIIEAFMKETDLIYKSVGYKLKQAKSLRVKADYKINDNFTKNDAETALLQSEKVIKILDSLPDSK